MFGPMAKWVAQIDSADRIPELVSRAFHVATSGRPGPVVLALPEDMLVEESDAPDARPYEITRVHPAPADLERVRALLAGAERPLVVVGGAPWSAEAHAELTAWCERERAAGRVGLAPPGLRRQLLRRLRRPPRARRRPAARAAGARRRRPARDRRPPERDHDGRLHAAPRARSRPGARARHRRPRRARPRVRAGARDRRLAGDVRTRARGAAAARSVAHARRTRVRVAPTTSTTSATPRCRARSTWAT